MYNRQLTARYERHAYAIIHPYRRARCAHERGLVMQLQNEPQKHEQHHAIKTQRASYKVTGTNGCATGYTASEAACEMQL